MGRTQDISGLTLHVVFVLKLDMNAHMATGRYSPYGQQSRRVNFASNYVFLLT